jgi:hypothetical protein
MDEAVDNPLQNRLRLRGVGDDWRTGRSPVDRRKREKCEGRNRKKEARPQMACMGSTHVIPYTEAAAMPQGHGHLLPTLCVD